MARASCCDSCTCGGTTTTSQCCGGDVTGSANRSRALRRGVPNRSALRLSDFGAVDPWAVPSAPATEPNILMRAMDGLAKILTPAAGPALMVTSTPQPGVVNVAPRAPGVPVPMLATIAPIAIGLGVAAWFILRRNK